MAIELLLARADDGSPFLEGGLPAGSAAMGPEAPPPAYPQHLRLDTASPQELPVQRWGIIAPEGPEGERLLGLIEPLRRARQEQQGGAEVRVYRVPPDLDAASAAAWKSRVYWDGGVREIHRPRYLLVLGDLHQVSLETQQILAGDVFVGRLAFRSDDGYAAYVAKVLRWERAPSPAATARTLFCTVRDGTAATVIGQKMLAAPSLEACREGQTYGDFPAGEIVEIPHAPGADPSALLSAAAAPLPSLLFSVSHGIGPPRAGFQSRDERRALQGAMSFGGGRRLAAEDMAGATFLPGGAWVMLACYGGATPATSAYQPWLRDLREAHAYAGPIDALVAALPGPGEPPFVAALPQAVLASPEGPLAVIAHADIAWTYAFQDMGASPTSRAERFLGVFRAIVAGDRIGTAHRELLRHFTEASVELSTLYEAAAHAEAPGGSARPEDPAQAARRGHLWMLRQDLGGYLLLGDPAARLPLA